MNRRLMVFVLGLMVLQTGCGIHGKWRLERVFPATGGREFRIYEMDLRKDGSAQIIYEHNREPVEGTFEFQGSELAIMSPRVRGALTAHASLSDLDLGLTLVFDSREGMVETTFRRIW